MVFFTTLQAVHGGKGIFIEMEENKRILIVSSLYHISMISRGNPPALAPHSAWTLVERGLLGNFQTPHSVAQHHIYECL